MLSILDEVLNSGESEALKLPPLPTFRHLCSLDQETHHVSIESVHEVVGKDLASIVNSYVTKPLVEPVDSKSYQFLLEYYSLTRGFVQKSHNVICTRTYLREGVLFWDELLSLLRHHEVEISRTHLAKDSLKMIKNPCNPVCRRVVWLEFRQNELSMVDLVSGKWKFFVLRKTDEWNLYKRDDARNVHPVGTPILRGGFGEILANYLTSM